jgi:hypothetical protein
MVSYGELGGGVGGEGGEQAKTTALRVGAVEVEKRVSPLAATMKL